MQNILDIHYFEDCRTYLLSTRDPTYYSERTRVILLIGNLKE